ncbi:hypothetical protein [Desulfovibrio sp. Fe33]|uniref:hypothetical protein n=1 Tax=Desulfovibrio sp. Fe33 TaxID=3020842 RepID=UPI00234E0B19|nr:hypothetical protein [Desulfovibrio sp. Fe33]
MSDQGRRIEFGGDGPYLFQVLSDLPEAMLLEDHEVCLFRFNQLFLPVSLSACGPLADALTEMSQADAGPEREGMTPLEFDLSETLELPLLTGAAGTSFQFGDMIYLDVFFGETEARLCFSVPAAAIIGQILSQVAE